MKKCLTAFLTCCVCVVSTQAQSIYEPYYFGTFAGIAGYGSADGTGNAARFRNPGDVAVDSAGNVYVADWLNHTIRKITPAGVVSTLAGSPGSQGNADGVGAAAQLNFPRSVAVDTAGNVYVASAHAIRKITPAAVVTTLAGSANGIGSADGTGSAARFRHPDGVAVDSAGNLWVADTYNHTIRKITPAGVVSTVAGLAGSQGSADGAGNVARFRLPQSVAVDQEGVVYVADTYNQTIRRINPDGVVETVAGLAGSQGSANGNGSVARFRYPCGVAVDSAGDVYVADRSNQTVRKITPAGQVTTLAGSALESGSADGTGSTARFNEPNRVAVGSDGNAYVADGDNYRIRKITPAALVTTLAGANSPGRTDGTVNDARFFQPYGVAVDTAGNLYVADSGNQTLRKIMPSGVVDTLAGLAGNRGSADGSGSDARFKFPNGVAVDSAGTVYVTDGDNHTVRKITSAGAVSTLAGLAGNSGSSEGTGSAARFFAPRGLALDSAGNLYVADNFNHTIRKITQAGVVTTLAGMAGSAGSADGTGSNARFNYPTGVAVDSGGSVYVVDYLNSTIRKITPDGFVNTLAGLAGSTGIADGTVSAARFGHPTGVAVDSAGNVFVVDQDNQAIRKITPAGVVTTIAGSPGSQNHDNGIGSAARFLNPVGVCVGSTGNVYVADTGNDTIRVGRTAPLAPTVAQLQNQHILINGEAGPNLTVDISATADLTADFLPIARVIADAQGKYQFEDMNGASAIRRFYRASIHLFSPVDTRPSDFPLRK